MYKQTEFPKLMQTAGKISILTALVGVMVFVVAFLFDAGTKELHQASAAGTATTSLTVLNTPPAFSLNAYEVTDSSTSTPTNSGTAVQWRAVGTDSNAAPYFLLVCKTNASPTPAAASGINNLGTAAPNCGGGTTNRWAVSAGTASGVAVTVSTTTTEGFVETNNWYAWVCDDDPFNPRCNNVPVQGPTSTAAFSSPFYVNHRPTFTNFYNNGPKNPGQAISFYSTSTDPDTVTARDRIYLVVCQTNGGINATTRTCNTGGLASSTSIALDNATSTYTLAAIVRDDAYPAYGYIVDQHGHTASANPRNQNFTVNSVAPTLLGGDITLNGGSNITLTVPANETTGFTLDFTVRDANSCKTAANTSEITDYRVALYRSSYGTTTCSGLAAAYNANYCYAGGNGGVSTGKWNLSCTASTTSCTGPTDDTQLYNCTFPLWFVADPTDAGPQTPAAFAADTWKAAVRGTDDDGASSALVAGTIGVELISFTALDLITAQIPYGSLEPGNNNASLSASTTVKSVGNTGLDQQVTGESMCSTYSVSNECRASATSTIAETNQKFSSSSVGYTNAAAVRLSSTTAKEVELNVPKTTSTTTPNRGYTYWGIGVPGTITYSGVYQGLNSFIAKVAEAADW